MRLRFAGPWAHAPGTPPEAQAEVAQASMAGHPQPQLPAEWATQSGVLLTWPHRHSDWAPSLPPVEAAYTALTTAISRFEPVVIACYDEAHRRHVQDRLRRSGAPAHRLRLYTAPSNDTWTRDHGPITVLLDRRPRLLDFRFDGWGGKYAAELDDRLTRRLHEAGAFGDTSFVSSDLVLEGGSIETDGAGTLLTTARCLLHGNRNPGLDRSALEDRLRELLGVDRILWLHHGAIPGDDTDGHIDMLARFCDTRTLAYVHCDREDDEAYEELAALEQELAALHSVHGEPYRLVALPWPQAVRAAHRRRLPASYANFLIINGAVLVPAYADPADAQALRRLAPCFPGRELIPIDARAFIRENGSLHCAAMQLPAGVLP